MKKIKIIVALLFVGVGLLMLNMKSEAEPLQSEPQVGDIAPEITGKSPLGQELNLSSLKGKIVLIDFWASWCPPCRVANKTVVKTYNKYKNKKFKNADGFTVFSVSLDTDISKWKSAIKADKLFWDTHINDIQAIGEKSSKQTYQVKAIPTTYLVDGDGKIIAKNIHGAELERELRKLSQ